MRRVRRDARPLTLRSAAWDGPAPAPGDVVQLADGTVAVVQLVAAGAGVGQWRLECAPARLIRWRGASWR